MPSLGNAIRIRRQDLVISNEELQATNEELETMNEELQATVEELNTANDDLTARSRQLEEAALERERYARLGAVLNSMTDAVAFVSPDEEMVFANTAYDEQFGRPLGELAVTNFEGEPFTGAEMLIKRISSGESFVVQVLIATRQAEAQQYEIRGEPIQQNANQRGGLIILRSVSEDEIRRG